MGHDVHSLMNIFIHLLFLGKLMVNKINKVPILLELGVLSGQQTTIIKSYTSIYKLIEFERGGTEHRRGVGFGEYFLDKATLELRHGCGYMKGWRITPERANNVYKSLPEVRGSFMHSRKGPGGRSP